jgi:DNA-binding response OmpR family regulator
MGPALDRPLGSRERAVLDVLMRHRGNVVDRSTLRHEAGLDQLSARRCESVLVGVRRLLGAGELVTVRQRGWRLTAGGLALAAGLVAGPG